MSARRLHALKLNVRGVPYAERMTLGTPKPVTPFCAICTSDIVGEPRQAPLGKAGALVNVCDACNDDVPIATVRESGYVPPRVGPRQGAGALVKQFRQGSKKVLPPRSTKDRSINVNYQGVQPGYEAVRVPNHDDQGRPRDNRDAYAIAVARWGEGISLAGMTARHFVFQRPLKSKASAAIPTASEAVESIRKYQRDQP